MLLAFVALSVLVVVGVMLLAAGKADPLEPDPVVRGVTGDDADVGSPEQVTGIRFPVVLRGYRMDDVDAVLERLSHELAERDTQIHQLRTAVASPGTTASGLPRRAVQAPPELDVFGRPIPPDDDGPVGDSWR